MLSWIFVLEAIIVVVEPLPFGYISVSNEQYPTLPINIVPHTFKVLLLPAFPKLHKKRSYFDETEDMRSLY